MGLAPNQTKAILFDLDGTLIDTAPDLALALNILLAQHQRATLPFETIRRVCSLGARGLLSLGFGINQDDPSYAELRRCYLNIYQDHLIEKTTLFPGTNELLRTLKQHQIAWGIVTNKPKYLTTPLLAHFALTPTNDCLVTADCVSNMKPHPEPVLKACEILKLTPQQCSFVGDSDRDALAAQAAGINKIFVATYGYIPPDQDPNQWPGTPITDLSQLQLA